MPKGSEIHHSQSLPAQKANHLSRGTGTTPHPPRRRVISRGSIQAAIASLYPPCQQRRRDARAEDETAEETLLTSRFAADGEAVWMKPGFTRASDKEGTFVIIRGTERFVFD